MSDIFIEADIDRLAGKYIDQNCDAYFRELTNTIKGLTKLIDKAGEIDPENISAITDLLREADRIEYNITSGVDDMMYECVSDGLYAGGDHVADAIISLNDKDDDALIVLLNEDTRYFDYIINPSEDVRNIKKFKEDL